MHPSQLITQLLSTAALAAALYVISRMLFLWAMQAVVSAKGRPGGGRLVQLLRLPGNLVHELGHATGYLLCGYTVRRMVPCIFDAAGRGSCQPGRPWLPVAVPWLATGLAALLPLVFGVLVLRLAADALGVTLTAPQLTGGRVGTALVGGLAEILGGFDWASWRTYVFLYLAFSIGAELAPSDIDLRRSLPAIVVATACVTVVILAFGRLDPASTARVWLGENLSLALAWLSALLNFGILTTLVAGAISAVPAALIRVARSH